MTIQECVLKTQNLQGSLIELGVYIGTTAAEIQRANHRQKPLYLVDSFEGLPAPTAEDSDTQGLKEGDWKADYEEIMRKFPQPNIHVVKGVIPEVFKLWYAMEFCFAHLDLDFYKATLDSLEFVEPRLVNHGIIMVHDAHLLGVKRAISTYFTVETAQIVVQSDNYWVWRKHTL